MNIEEITKDHALYLLNHDIEMLDMKNEILNTPHEIVIKDNVIRWKEEEGARDKFGDLNKVVSDMNERCITKNDEEWRDIYRKIGYSLYGYWEVFYWEANNEDARDYNFIPTTHKQTSSHYQETT